MIKLFLSILSLSLSGAFIGLVILLIHPITQRLFSKRWNYYIWLLVIARLLIPIQFGFHFTTLPALNSEESLSHTTAKQYNNRNDSATADSTIPNSIQKQDGNADNLFLQENNMTSTITKNKADNSLFYQTNKNTAAVIPLKFSPQFPSLLIFAAAIIWFIGTASAFSIKIWNYRRFTVCLQKNNTPVADKHIIALANTLADSLHICKKPVLYENPSICSPITVGLQSTSIILPKGNPVSPIKHSIQENDLKKGYCSDCNSIDHETMLRFILQHEFIHIMRKDLWYKWGYQLLLCVHWFNPILYIIERRLNTDCELSCDEMLLSQQDITQEDKKTYGNLLIDTAQRTAMLQCLKNAFTTTLIAPKSDLKKRLHGILHYKKLTRLRLAISICVFVCISIFTAGCSVQYPSNTIMSAMSAQTTSMLQKAAILATAKNAVKQTAKNILTSQSNIHSDFWESLVEDWVDDWTETWTDFITAPDTVDQTKDAWKVYYDEAAIAGKDISDIEQYYSYWGGKNLKCKGMQLNGSTTLVIANASKEIDIIINSSFILKNGNLKLVQVLPDNTVLTLNETGTETKQTITMKQGRNMLKLVGQGALAENLNVNYTLLNERDFESVYFSEEEEYASLIPEYIAAGITVEKDTWLNVLPYIESTTGSEGFAALLHEGISFSVDELAAIFIYTDTQLSSKYLLEAIQNGSIPQPDPLSPLIPYLDDDIKTELLTTLPIEDFLDTFQACIIYLDSDEIEYCLLHYLENGGKLSYTAYSYIAMYLDESTIEKIDRYR